MTPKQQRLLKVVLAASLLLVNTPLNNAKANDKIYQRISSQLEDVLNSGDSKDLAKVLPKEQANFIVLQRKKFREQFPNATWSIKQFHQMQEPNNLIEITVNGRQAINGKLYSLIAKQLLAIEISQEKIISSEIISEHSRIENLINPLPVILQIPDEVLTGSKYDIDLIFQEPLGDSILAGGLILITQDNKRNQLSPAIELSPLVGGGIFKSAQAPLKEGSQHWSALLVHPEGLISINKMVRIIQE